MKFSDGAWSMREGVAASYAAEGYDAVVGERSLTVTAPVRPIADREDTLNTPLLTVTFTSPMRNVVGVEVTHFAGAVDRGPDFALARDGDGAQATTQDEAWLLRNGDLGVRVRRGAPWTPTSSRESAS